MQADYVVLGGDNARLLTKLPPVSAWKECPRIRRGIPFMERAVQWINVRTIHSLHKNTSIFKWLLDTPNLSHEYT